VIRSLISRAKNLHQRYRKPPTPARTEAEEARDIANRFYGTAADFTPVSPAGTTVIEEDGRETVHSRWFDGHFPTREATVTLEGLPGLHELHRTPAKGFLSNIHLGLTSDKADGTPSVPTTWVPLIPAPRRRYEFDGRGTDDNGVHVYVWVDDLTGEEVTRPIAGFWAPAK
jgi:hypothetical protein